MTGHSERRRERRCPSCRGANVMRGPQVGGVVVPLPHASEGRQPVTTDAYADVCYDCGMVTMFVRLSEATRTRGLVLAVEQRMTRGAPVRPEHEEE